MMATVPVVWVEATWVGNCDVWFVKMFVKMSC